MNKELIHQVAVHAWFPTLADHTAFDQNKIAHIVQNAYEKNYSIVHKNNLFDLLVDSVQWIDTAVVYNNNYYRAVIWRVRDQIVYYFQM